MGLYRFPPVRDIGALRARAGRSLYSAPRAAERRPVPAGRGSARRHLADRAVAGSRATGSLASRHRRFPAYDASDGTCRISPRGRRSRVPSIVEGPPVSCSSGFERPASSPTGTIASRRFSIAASPFGRHQLHLDRRESDLGDRRRWFGSRSTIRQRAIWSIETQVARSLAGATCGVMAEDASGHFYFGTTSGVIEVDPRPGHSWRHTTAEGLAQNEVWSALASTRGDLWFGTIAGVSRLDATRRRRRTPVPRDAHHQHPCERRCPAHIRARRPRGFRA